ncbi:MAG: hypothetical protein ACTHU0_08725, partial [Kofleriaceae bacterium]
MIRRTRHRLIALSIAIALIVGITCHLLLRVDAAELISLAAVAPLAAAITAFAIAMFVGLVVKEMFRRSLRQLTDATRDVVRDTSRRVPHFDAPRGDDV